MKKKLLVVGGKGSGEIAMSVFEAVNSVNHEWDLEGFLSDVGDPGQRLGKHLIVGGSNEVEHYVNKGYYIHYALHFNAKKKEERVKKFEQLNIPLEANATAIHPLAYLAEGTNIGHGVIMLPFSATSFGATIDNFVHVYTTGFIGHDSTVHNYCTIAAHSVIGARIHVKQGAHIGLNSVIREDLTIGKYAIVGMSSVVTKSVEDKAVVVGSPAKTLKYLS